MELMVDHALKYLDNGLSIIPVGKSKIPFKGFEWMKYQTQKPTKEEIVKWWEKWPYANIAIITGKLSNLTVVDADSQKGKLSLEDLFLPENLSLPISQTPREGGGWHYFFRYVPGVRNSQTGDNPIITDCDIRSEGGYVVAPPSKNGNGKHYGWLAGLEIFNVAPPVMPEELAATLLQGQRAGQTFASSNSPINALDPLVNAPAPARSNNSATDFSLLSKTVQNCPVPSKMIIDGERDKALFHLANHLVKGDMPIDNIRFFLEMFLTNCCEQGKEPYNEKNLQIKINSALNRQKNRDRNISQEIRETVLSFFGLFLSKEIQECLKLSKRAEKKLCSQVLSTMVDEGYIERVEKKNGCFRRISEKSTTIDIFNVKEEYLDVKFPLELNEFFRPMPKNIVIVAGTQDVGKTAFMLNIARLNVDKELPIRYFTSEMGGGELKSRVLLFDDEMPLHRWKKVEFKERSNDFHDEILPDGLNIIDYLEITDSFYKIGEPITKIHDKLNKGIAVIALQKDFKSDLGRGGTFSLEKPRLYLTLTANPPEGNIAKIVKCKNWARQDINPNHRECVFKIVQGCKIKKQTRWALPYKEDK